MRAARSLLKVCCSQRLHLRVGLQVAGQADLERDAPVGDVVAELFHVAVAVLDLRVADLVRLEQVGAVADAVRVQVRDRLEDRLRAVGLARVHRALQEVLVRELEGRLVRARGIPRLLAREVEADHLQAERVAREDRRAHRVDRGHRVDVLRARERVRGEQRVVVAAESRAEHPQRTADDPVLEGRLAPGGDLRPAVVGVARAAQAAVHGGQHLDRVQARPHVQLRREAHLEVAHALRLVVLGQLRGDPLERLGRLHHGDRVAEALQVVAEAGVALLIDGLAQAGFRVARQLHAAARARARSGSGCAATRRGARADPSSGSPPRRHA